MAFLEKQRFTQWWIWLSITGVIIMVLVFPLSDLIADPAAFSFDWSMLIGLLIPSLVVLLFFVLRLETEIGLEGVSVRFFPFHIKTLFFPWAEIEQIYVRQYKPIVEYGGWGLRFGKGGKAYNVSGNKGIQIIFKDGKKLLIGTRHVQEAQHALQQLGKSTPESDVCFERR